MREDVEVSKVKAFVVCWLVLVLRAVDWSDNCQSRSAFP